MLVSNLRKTARDVIYERIIPGDPFSSSSSSSPSSSSGWDSVVAFVKVTLDVAAGLAVVPKCPGAAIEMVTPGRFAVTDAIAAETFSSSSSLVISITASSSAIFTTYKTSSNVDFFDF